jgi:hypothetical protein
VTSVRTETPNKTVETNRCPALRLRLESDGMVKLLNTRKHRKRNKPYEADQGLDQNAVRFGLSNVARRE